MNHAFARELAAKSGIDIENTSKEAIESLADATFEHNSEVADHLLTLMDNNFGTIALRLAWLATSLDPVAGNLAADARNIQIELEQHHAKYAEWLTKVKG